MEKRWNEADGICNRPRTVAKIELKRRECSTDGLTQNPRSGTRWYLYSMHRTRPMRILISSLWSRRGNQHRSHCPSGRPFPRGLLQTDPAHHPCSFLSRNDHQNSIQGDDPSNGKVSLPCASLARSACVSWHGGICERGVVEL